MDTLIDLFPGPRDLTFGDANQPHRQHQIIRTARRDALNIGFLTNGGQGFLSHPARFKKAREVGSLAQLWKTQLYSSGSCLAIAAAVAIALGNTVRRLPIVSLAGCSADLHLNQPLGSKADHVVQNIRVGACSTSVRRSIRVLVIGRSSVQGWCRDPILTEIIDDHRKPAAPPQRYMKSARSGGLATLNYTALGDTTFLERRVRVRTTGRKLS